jgi:uncharacterized protein (DUF362 family)
VSVYAFVDPRLAYPNSFSPSKQYPEYAFRETSSENLVYDAVRGLLAGMGLDREHFGGPDWNPLGAYISPGQKVVIKPNMVRHFNPVENDITSLVTHASLVRAIADYCYIALRGEGTLVVGDAPVQSADFARILELTRLNEVRDFYARYSTVDFRLVDFRQQVCSADDPVVKSIQVGDPKGYTTVDLGVDSLHHGRDVDFRNCRVTDYDPKLMRRCHNEKNHQYLISNTVLSADVVVSLPKLKTHRKAGLTCALKNAIGINCLKDYLPHHTRGSVEEHGDEYMHRSLLKRLQSGLLDCENSLAPCHKGLLKAVRLLKRVNQRVLHSVQRDVYVEGSWYGNDTIWRTIVDLNRVLMYSDHLGQMRESVQRKCLVFVDAVIAGEGEGPLEPRSKHCGLLIAGTCPLEVDFAAARFMGFDPKNIPQIRNGLEVSRYPIVQGQSNDFNIIIFGEEEEGRRRLEAGMGFVPSAGWRDHIERVDS